MLRVKLPLLKVTSRYGIPIYFFAHCTHSTASSYAGCSSVFMVLLALEAANRDCARARGHVPPGKDSETGRQCTGCSA